MKMGLRVALVSDAGTPTISDPGFKFIKEARDQGVLVEALPGPCAVTTALSASGFPSDRFSFMGYLPKAQGEREDVLMEIQRSGKTTALYENAGRLVRSLGTIEDVFGPDHQVYIGMELTKRNEAHYRDTVSRVREHLEQVSEGTRLKGEVTMVLAPWRREDEEEYREMLRSSTFDPNRDAQVRVDLVQIAERLNNEIEMSEGEFRSLLQALFAGNNVPSYHLKTVVRMVRSNGKKRRADIVAARLGGII